MDSKNIAAIAIVGIIIVGLIIFLFVGILLARKIYKTKIKKHMNILDDNFDYTIQPANNEIEMSKKLYE